jgi:anthranilate phosphoribosyltransferase
MWTEIFSSLDAGVELSNQQLTFAFDAILREDAEQTRTKDFLTKLHYKGETAREVQIATEILLSKSLELPTEEFADDITIDTCGTGGDGLHTVNISTMVALVIATSGAKVFKHGNRAASSKSGSADVLEALGISLNVTNETLLESARRANIAFLFAQHFHPLLRYVAPIRRELGFRTIFNFLGPLANPARPNTQIVGVSDRTMADVVASSLARRGVRSMVIRGIDGLDEVSVAERTEIWVHQGTTDKIENFTISPETFGEKPISLELIRGADAQRNAQTLSLMAKGKASDAIHSAVAMNAACALSIIDSHSSVIDDFESVLSNNYRVAQDIIHSGRVFETLEVWRDIQRI